MFTQKKNKYKYQMYRKLCLETTRNNIVELKAMFNIAISWELNCRHCSCLNETVPNHFEMNILWQTAAYSIQTILWCFLSE